MKTPYRGLVFIVVCASILLLVCSLASISASNAQIPKASGEKKAQSQDEAKKQSIQDQIKKSLATDFTSSYEKTLKANNVVMTCETESLLSGFAQAALDKATITAVQHSGGGDPLNNQTVNDAEKQFRVFLDEQLKAGEKIRGGKVLLTQESFNETTARICPLIPIC